MYNVYRNGSVLLRVGFISIKFDKFNRIKTITLIIIVIYGKKTFHG